MRAAAGSERWRPEQTHPGRLVDHAVEVGRASGCASGAQTASRSSCAHVATPRSPRCQRTTEQRRGRAHVCRAGSCAMVLLDSTAVKADIHRSRACSHDTEVSYPRARCRSFRAAFLPGSGRCRWSDHIESRCARRCHHPASTCQTQEYGAQMPFFLTSHFSIGAARKRYRRQAASA